MKYMLLASAAFMAGAVQASDVDQNAAAHLSKAFFLGPPATELEELKAYTGASARDAIVGAHRKKAYELNLKQLGINYGNTVEYQLRLEQVVLCPQTEQVLYSEFTSLKPRYAKGTRPRLERVVQEAASGCHTETEKALALMRYCRDLYREEWYGKGFENYIYGGTEEELIDKGEILCECLGRLHVALCEVAGLPGRIVMHDIGGHICSEIHVDGGWAYMDPRCGIYFRKGNGALASVRDLLHDPGIIRAQATKVKEDCSPWWNWEERAWKCENLYFRPEEINGFQNYSLSDAGRFSYAQKSMEEATKDGLWDVNKEYCREIDSVFGLAEGGFRFKWGARPLRRIPIAYRHDGFSIYFQKPPMTPRVLEELYVDPLANTNASILVWGLGPGSVLCYGTKVCEVFGEDLTEAQRKMVREGDLWVHENVTGLINSGNDPLRVAVKRSHELGLKLFARLEMNHEFGPASAENWKWVALVGKLNKEHPEYRIGNGCVLLDFKHQEVRELKLGIFREALEAEADGIAMDFAVYPPFFADPKQGLPVMTEFVRDVRSLLDEFTSKNGQKRELMVRVPALKSGELGLDWAAWMKEGLVDYIVPTHYRANSTFDIRVDDFVALGNRTGVKVFPTIWQALGFVDTDPRPDGTRRYDKPKTEGMFNAQALLFHRAGVDGLQLGFSQDQWRKRPYLNNLADPERLEVADKHYMVGVRPHCPIRFALPESSHSGAVQVDKEVPLRVADDLKSAKNRGYAAATSLVLYAKPLREGETLEVYINGQGPLAASPKRVKEDDGDAAVNPLRIGENSRDREWWRRGELRISVDPSYWNLGENTIRFRYSASRPPGEDPFYITWVDLLIDYTCAEKTGAQ